MATMRAVIAFTILLSYTKAEVYSDHVTSPIMLYRGDFIESMSKNSKLVMQQADGNLVLYNTTNSPSIAVWSSNTIDATYTEITSDGNITVKDDNDRIYWSSNSGGHNASEYYLVVMDFCAYLMDPHYTVLWSTCEDACNVRYPTFAPPTSKGDTPVHVPTAQPTHPPTVTHLNHIVIAQNSSFILQASDERIYSLSMTTFFIMQRDGNALLYVIKDGCQQDWVFKTRTDRTGAEYMEFKSDGNIIVTDRNHTIYWQSNSGGYLASAPHRFVVIDECAYLANRYDHILYIIGNCNCSDTAFDPPTMAIGSPTGAPTPKPTPIYMDHASTSTNNSFFLYPLDRIASRSLNTFATFQSDGNFVLYVDQGCRHKAIWSTNTQNKDAKYVVLMRNGNLKVMGKNGTVLFTSDTYENGRPQPQHLVVTDECMYLMDGDYTMYWHQGSGCAVFNGTFPTFSAPTAEPSPTKQPTTIQPTLSPTVYPTITPTLPTSEPTKITIFPTIFPTQIPTTIPTKVPTKSTSDPTKIPTNAPITAKPTDITTFPTVFQTQNPTKTPTKVPIKLTADPTNTLTNAPITDDPTMFVIISSTYKATESDQEEDDTVTKNGSNIWVLVVVFLLSMVTMFALLFGLMRFVMYRSQKQKTQARNEPQNMTHTQMRHFSQDNQANVAVNVQKMSSMSVESCHIATGMDTGNVAEDSVESEGGQLTAEGPEVDLEAMEVEEHQTQGNDNVQEDEFIVVGDEEVGNTTTG
eukprot:1056373_1